MSTWVTQIWEHKLYGGFSHVIREHSHIEELAAQKFSIKASKYSKDKTFCFSYFCHNKNGIFYHACCQPLSLKQSDKKKNDKNKNYALKVR